MITWHDFDTFQPLNYGVYLIAFKGSKGIYTAGRSFMYVAGTVGNGWNGQVEMYGKPIKITEFPEYTP